MAEITETQAVLITRTVRVEFDHDNRPEFDMRGKRYQAVVARIKFTYRNGIWCDPWSISGHRAQKLKDGSWGVPVGAEMHDRDLITELSDEFRPTAIITITEESN